MRITQIQREAIFSTLWNMFKKRLFAGGMLLAVLLLGFCAYQYHLLTSCFLLGGLRFQLSDNILVAATTENTVYATQMGREIGTIDEQVYLYPSKDGQGFKVPEGSVVYRVNDNLPETQYDIILKTPRGKLYRGSLYLKEGLNRAEVLMQFNKQFG